MTPAPRRGEALARRLDALLDLPLARGVWISAVLLSVLHLPGVERHLRGPFFVFFGVEWALRAFVYSRLNEKRTRLELALLAVDLLAWLSFAPAGMFHTRHPEVFRLLRLMRLLTLLRFAQGLIRDLAAATFRREQRAQIGLVLGIIVALSLGSAIVLGEWGVEYDWDAHPETRESAFHDRAWWAFRQLESPDNLIANLRVHPLIGALSIGLSLVGVLVVSYVIGIGGAILEQVVRAGRLRPVGLRGHTVVVAPPEKSERLVSELLGILRKNRALQRFSPMTHLRHWLGRGPKPRRHALVQLAVLGHDEEPPAYLLRPDLQRAVYRAGHSADDAALELVSIDDARRILVVSDGTSADEADAAALAGVAAIRQRNRSCHVHVAVRRAEHVAVVESTGGPHTTVVDLPRFVGLMLAHQLLVPGVESVYQELLEARGSELYTHLVIDRWEASRMAALGGEDGTLSFEEVAEQALRDHGVVLTGAFLGPARAGVSATGAIDDDGLEVWAHPISEPRAELAELGARGGRIPMNALRGWIGIADSYVPMRDFSRSLARDGIRSSSRTVEDVHASFEARAPGLRRVSIVGHSPALGSLLAGLDTFARDLQIDVILAHRRERRDALEHAVDALEECMSLSDRDGCREAQLDHGSRVRVHERVSTNPNREIARALDKAEPDAVVFMSDTRAADPDAATVLRVLGAAEARDHRGTEARTLVELQLPERGASLSARLEALVGEDAAPLAAMSTAELEDYFMVQGIFVPGVTQLYDRLLARRGREFVRLERVGALPDGLRFGALHASMLTAGWIVVAVVSGSGETLVNPAADLVLSDVGGVRALFALGHLPETATSGG